MNKFSNNPRFNNGGGGSGQGYHQQQRGYQNNRGKYPQQRRQREDPTELHPSKVNNAEALFQSFNKRSVQRRSYEDNDQLVRRFKRVVEASGVMGELKKREFYMSRGQKDRDKLKKAEKRAKKRRAEEKHFED